MVIASAALAGIQLAGGYFASQNAKVTAKLNRDINELNAEFAELDDHNAKIDGYSEIARYQKVIDQTLGEQQAILTGADVDVNYGSAADIQNETVFIGELNKMELEKQAQESASGFRNQARQYRVSGQLGYSRGIQESETMKLQGLSSAISTGIRASGY